MLKLKLTGKRKFILVVVCTAAAVILILPAGVAFFLSRVPPYYKPVSPPNAAEVSPYLTNYIAPEIHNKSQLGEPFELVITEAGFNDIIARGPWRPTSGGASIARPAIIMTEGRILLMATVKYSRVPVVMTVFTSPKLDEAGLLCLNLEKVSAGSLDVTLIVKKVIEEIINPNVAGFDGIPAGDIASAMLENKPFEPVFNASDGQVRLTGIDIRDGEVVLQLTPQAER